VRVFLDALLSLAAPPLCWSCGAPARGDEPLCRSCRLRLCWLGPAYAGIEGVRAWAPVAYEGPARALVQALKFRGAAGLAEAMAAPIVAGAPPGLLEAVVLVPVPLHRVRLRKRGFSQAQRLAAAVARRAGLDCAPCLERRGDATPQMGRPRAERLAALRDSIGVVRDVPATALLVDDVITTGGTLAACAAALESGGCRVAGAVAYARTLGR
jgi:predicted amidophosphoribosyltransferase